MSQYIFRVDDICPQQDYFKVDRLFSIFKKYNIKPIVGVIPDNKDDCFKNEFKPDFWLQIKKYQDLGWSIALHGYQHIFHTHDSGIMGINSYSEFAGRPYSDQLEDLKKGKRILESKGIKVDAFMAPAHSFDINTLLALREVNVNYITDGYGLFPFEKKGVIMVPQLFAKHRKMPFGVYTNCIHTHLMNDNDFIEIENFIKENRKNIISYSEALKSINNNFGMKLINYFIKMSVRILRFLN